MGLSSVLSTAISGLQASETVIDVSGNNIANANTAGFKASNIQFATQFLQTLSIGSAPSGNNGGTDPQQIGLGTQVASITPDFTQGTLQLSSSPSDLAIQGDGFFIVQAHNGEQLYTRNGAFTLNSQNQLVTNTGSELLGFGVDDNYNIQSTTLTSLTIPLGSAAVAKATQNVFLQGTLSPTGAVATTAEVIQTGPLGDANVQRPDTTSTVLRLAGTPDVSSSTTTASNNVSGNLTSSSTYSYIVVFGDGPLTTTPPGTESLPSAAISASTGATDNQIVLNNVPTDSTGHYATRRIYRTNANGTTYKLVGEIADNTTTTFTDRTADTSLGATLNSTTISGNYSYYVTYATKTGGPGTAGDEESRPSQLIGPLNVVNGRTQLTNLPTPALSDTTPWLVRRIYRCSATDPNDFHFVAEIPISGASSFSDNVSDTTIAANARLDQTGPRATSNSLLVNLLQSTATGTTNLFQTGTLNFTGTKGLRTLASKSLTITNTTTLQDLIGFMSQGLGIHTGSSLPSDAGSGLAAGGYVTSNGEIKLVGNNGADNAIAIGQSGFQLVTSSGTTPVGLTFSSVQSAVGTSAVADFLVYDSLGIPLNVRVTAVLQSLSGSQSTFRWFADSSQNDPAAGVDIGAGTGLITFDGTGKLISSTNSSISIDRVHVPSNKPLTATLDFSQVSGLSATQSSLAAARQDGFPPGKLTTYTIGNDGVIQGTFDNGTQRNLGEIRLARFANAGGLEQRGQNLFAAGVNSGLAVENNPGQEGTGTIISGAVELSNTDLSKSLISLITASQQYQGNARVISATQQLLSDLLNITR